jgi:hypothetical protein
MRPWEKYKKDSNEINIRFSAPYIKSLDGRPMVFAADQEREIYFNHLKAQL